MITLDIPQANALDKVRRVVKVISLGANSAESVAALAEYSSRHASYRIHAARILGFVQSEGDNHSLTPRGEQLLDTQPYSAKERATLFSAIESSAVIQVLAPDLLTLCPPSRYELADRLFKNSKLSRETADRRANGLLSWRKYVLGETPKPSTVSSKPGVSRTPKRTPKRSLFGEQLSLF
ncbi:MAG: DUF7226 domain-containing protein [Bradymonadia bacterium]